MRKKIVENIYYDDKRDKYYVKLNYGGGVIKTKTFHTLKEAKRELRNFLNDKEDEVLVDPTHITFKDFGNSWLEYKKINCEKNTTYAYEIALNKHVYPMFGQKDIKAVTTNDIVFYIRTKLKEVSKNTVRKHYDMLKQMFSYAVMTNLIKANPVDPVLPPKKTRTEISIYSAADMKKLLEVTAGTRMEIIIELAGGLGMRREEICGLKWSCVDLVNKRLVINSVRTYAGDTIEKEPKSYRSRRVLAIPDHLIDTLIKVKQEQEDNRTKLEIDQEYEYVVSDIYGVPMRPNYVSDCFKKVIDDAHLPHITLHGLRHTWASLANAEGVPLYEISRSLGHSNVNITEQIYVSLLEETHRQSINAVANVLY